MRVVLVCAMSLVLVAAGTTAAGAAHRASRANPAASIRVNPRFGSVTTSSCVTLIIGLRASSPVSGVDVTQQTDMEYRFLSRRPNTGPRTPAVIFRNVRITTLGASFTERYCNYGDVADGVPWKPITVTVDAGQSSPATYQFVVSPTPPGGPPRSYGLGHVSADGKWSVHCANC